MRESKLVKLIATLPAWDQRHLRDFVHSPFFNKHERLTKLMDLVLDSAPEFPAQSLERKEVFAEVFGKENWDEQKFKDLLSLGVKLLKQFLGQMRLREHNFPLQLAAVEGMRERNWDVEYVKAREQLAQGIEEHSEKMQERYLIALQLQESWITHISAIGSRKLDDSLQTASDQLDAFFILSKLKYGVGMVNRQNVLAEAFKPGLLPKVLEHVRLDEGLLRSHPVIRIYKLIYDCLSDLDDQGAFEQLRKEIGTSVGDLPKMEQREIYGFAFNQCIRQVNQGRREFLSTLLELYQEALEKGALLWQGWLSQWDYKNIVSAGLKAGNFAWSEKFIEEYKEKVEPEARENAFTYNLACLHFEQGDYKRALRLLQHVEFIDVFYHLGAKVMLLKSYYELNDFDALNSLCDSFKIYLKRNKTLSKTHYDVNYNLVGFTRRLAELRRKSELIPVVEARRKLTELRQKITEKGAVAQLAWLLGKVDAFGKGI